MKKDLVSRVFLPAMFFLCLFLFCCGTGKRWHASSFFFFDTICDVNLYTTQSQFASAQRDIQDVFTDIQTYFAPEAQDYTSQEVLELYRKAFALYDASRGAFDISVAPLSKLWGFLDGNHRVPDDESIKRAVRQIGMDKIKDNKISLEVPHDVSLDWGGIAKGYGIDVASRRLMGNGITRGFINAGGDLFCWGENPSNSSWKIGIKHPRHEGFLGVLEIRDLAAATAGDYQRFFFKEGIRYCHIFDPKTGYPANSKQSVTVIGPEAFLCDALSTALFVTSEPEKLLQKYPEYGAVLVDSKGVVSLVGKRYPFTRSPD